MHESNRKNESGTFSSPFTFPSISIATAKDLQSKNLAELSSGLLCLSSLESFFSPEEKDLFYFFKLLDSTEEFCKAFSLSPYPSLGEAYRDNIKSLLDILDNIFDSFVKNPPTIVLTSETQDFFSFMTTGLGIFSTGLFKFFISLIDDPRISPRLKLQTGETAFQITSILKSPHNPLDKILQILNPIYDILSEIEEEDEEDEEEDETDYDEYDYDDDEAEWKYSEDE